MAYEMHTDGRFYCRIEYYDEDFNGTGKGRVLLTEGTNGIVYHYVEYWDETEVVKSLMRYKYGKYQFSETYYISGNLESKIDEFGNITYYPDVAA